MLVVLEVAAEKVVAKGIVREVRELGVPVAELHEDRGFIGDVGLLRGDGEEGMILRGFASELVDIEADEEEDEEAGDEDGEEEADGAAQDSTAHVRDEFESSAFAVRVASSVGGADELKWSVGEGVAADEEEEGDHCGTTREETNDGETPECVGLREVIGAVGEVRIGHTVGEVEDQDEEGGDSAEAIHPCGGRDL